MSSLYLRPLLIECYGRENRQNTKTRIRKRIQAVVFSADFE